MNNTNNTDTNTDTNTNSNWCPITGCWRPAPAEKAQFSRFPSTAEWLEINRSNRNR